MHLVHSDTVYMFSSPPRKDGLPELAQHDVHSIQIRN